MNKLSSEIIALSPRKNTTIVSERSAVSFSRVENALNSDSSGKLRMSFGT
jgi:hypothetical protein